MKRKIIFLLLAIIFISTNVKAATCPNSEMEELKKIAEKIEFSYYQKWDTANHLDNGKEYIYPKFYITASNLNKKLKVLVENDFLKDDYVEFKGDADGKATVGPFYTGDKITITIRAYTETGCSSKVVTTKIIKMPYLNLLSYEPECSVYTDFEYCDEFTEEKITAEKFGAELKKYLEKKRGINNNAKRNNNSENKAQNQKTNYLLIGGISIGAIIIVGLFTFWKKKRNNI